MNSSIDKNFVQAKILEKDVSDYNLSFTKILRNLGYNYVWGNVTFNPRVAVGAIGLINPMDGSFEVLGQFHDEYNNVITYPEGHRIEYTDRHAKTTSAELGMGKSRYKVEFGEGEKVVTTISVAKRKIMSSNSLSDQKNIDKALDIAKQHDLHDADGNVPPIFGFIGAVYYSSSGTISYSMAANASMSIEGDSEIVKLITQSASPVLDDLNASLKYSISKDSVLNKTWPIDSRTASEQPFGYDFYSIGKNGEARPWPGFSRPKSVFFKVKGDYIIYLSVIISQKGIPDEEVKATRTSFLGMDVEFPNLDVDSILSLRFVVEYQKALGSVLTFNSPIYDSISVKSMFAKKDVLQIDVGGYWGPFSDPPPPKFPGTV